MKNFLILLFMLVMVSCGKKDRGSDSLPQLPEMSSSIYQGTDTRLTGLVVTLDLGLLNQTVSVDNFLPASVCTFNDGYPNEITITSSDGGRSGKIVFSALEYGGFNNPNKDTKCLIFNKESYDFTFDGNKLTLFAIAPGKSWDRAQSVFYVK